VREPLIKKTKQTSEELETGDSDERAELYDGEWMAEKRRWDGDGRRVEDGER
jgi:hypothetical protein